MADTPTDEQFYIAYPSNDSMDVSENIIANFTMELEMPLELKVDYDVGMCVIQYPNDVEPRAHEIKWIYSALPYRKIYKPISYGYYPTMQSLIKVLKCLIKIRYYT